MSVWSLKGMDTGVFAAGLIVYSGFRAKGFGSGKYLNDLQFTVIYELTLEK